MDVTCDECGGTNFYKEAGYYYCTECQRQTQDIQEQVLDQPIETVQVKLTKKVPATKRKDAQKAVERLTSWECYNYILLGLVNELIELGAGDSLKDTVLALWLKYLRVMQVIGNPDQPPKLSAVNSTVDAEIIYGRKTPKRRKSRSVSPSSTSDNTLDAQSLKKERTKKKRALVRAEYDTYNISQQSNTSVLNQSLSSLKGSSEATSKNVESYLQYNRFAHKQLKKVMKKSHLAQHRKDVHSSLPCHKLNYRMFQSAYTHGPEVLSRQRLYAIIYLGLLINKDKVQLGDMLRFIREGHLSYEHVQHFFPEDYDRKNLNIDSFSAGNNPFTHYSLRVIATKMAKLLKITSYIPTQNILEMCKRYCKELNLPDEICDHTMTVLRKTLPKMSFSKNSKILPNYEARAISFIIFSLKIFFGFDGETEFLLSDLASNINKNLLIRRKNKMFNFKEWLKYIEYRRLIIAEAHFPASYSLNNCNNSQLFINFMGDYNSRFGVEKDDSSVQMEVVKNLLQMILDSSNGISANVNFAPSLTPFYDYLLSLVSSDFPYGDYLTELLKGNFQQCSLHYLLSPKRYLEALNPNVQVEYKHGGANDQIEFTKIINKDQLRMKKSRQEKHMHNVTIVSKKKLKNAATSVTSGRPQENYSKIKINSFESAHSKTYKANEFIAENLCKTEQQHLSDNVVVENLDSKIYNPAERFWLHASDVSQKTEEECMKFLKNFPYAFRLVLRECARITEQKERNVFEEYNLVELYLCYADSVPTDKIRDKELEKLVKKAIKLW